jgi:hypothetical protein
MTPRVEFEGNALVTTPRLLEVAQGAGPLTAWLDPAVFKLVIRSRCTGRRPAVGGRRGLAAETQRTVSVVRGR